MWYGVKQDAVKIESFAPFLAPHVKQKALSVQTALYKGTLHPFTGPIYKQDGSLLIMKGKSMTDTELNKMNYYVKGVEGALPK